MRIKIYPKKIISSLLLIAITFTSFFPQVAAGMDFEMPKLLAKNVEENVLIPNVQTYKKAEESKGLIKATSELIKKQIKDNSLNEIIENNFVLPESLKTSSFANSLKTDILSINSVKASSPSNLVVKDPNYKTTSIVAILVDEKIWNHSPLLDSKPKDLIRRYAKDVSQNFPDTKSLILKVDENESVYNISSSLETLFLEGDIKHNDNNEYSQLYAVVLIGDVPVPVVNKKGNRFLSLLPYRDFIDPSYIYDHMMDEFVFNKDLKDLKAEVLLGVINPTGNSMSEKVEKLKKFFDRNHKTYSKTNDEYNSKLFYSDFIREKKGLSKTKFMNYLNFIKYGEEKVYGRYNKNLASTLYNKFNDSLKDGDREDNDGDGKIDEDPINKVDDDFDGELFSPLIGLIDGVDNNNDGEIDERIEGLYGFCEVNGGSLQLQYCGVGGEASLEDRISEIENYNKFNTVSGSKYKAEDGYDNDSNGVIDERIDEDDGDKFLQIDNDLDGLVDEDENDGIDNDGDGKIDEDVSEIKLGFEGEDDPFKDLLDSFSPDIINKYTSFYYQAFNKFLSTTNDFVKYTGRYKSLVNNYDGAVQLISKKDVEVYEFLKEVNDKVEARMNSVINNSLQKNIDILRGITIKGTVSTPTGLKTIKPITFVNGTHTKSYIHNKSDKTDVASYLNNVNNYRLRGIKLSNISQPYHCLQHRGSNESHNGVKSVFANGTRLLDSEVFQGIGEDLDDVNYEVYAGCLLMNMNNSKLCQPLLMTTSTFSNNGLTKVPDDVPYFNSLTSYESCYDFKEVEKLDTCLINYNFWMEKIDRANEDTDEIEAFSFGLPETCEQGLDEIIIKDNEGSTITFVSNNDRQTYALSLANIALGLSNKSNHNLNLSSYEDKHKFYAYISKFINQPIRNITAGDVKINIVVRSTHPTYSASSSSIELNDPSSSNNVAANIPSVYKNIEPNNLSLKSVTKFGSMADAIPSDVNRFVTFNDINNNFQKIYYPNAFRAESFDDFFQQLEAIENQMVDIAPNSLSTSLSVDIRKWVPEQFFDNKYSNYRSNFLDSTIDKDIRKIDKAIKWHNYNIEQKHDNIVFDHLSNSEEACFFDEVEGYETVYFVSDGSPTHFAYDINKDFNDPDEDSELNSPLLNSDGSEGENEKTALEALEEDASSLLGDFFPDLLKWIEDLLSFKLEEDGGGLDICSFAEDAKNEFPTKEEDIKDAFSDYENNINSENNIGNNLLDQPPTILRAVLETPVLINNGADIGTVKVYSLRNQSDIDTSLQSNINSKILTYEKSLKNYKEKFRFLSAAAKPFLIFNNKSSNNLNRFLIADSSTASFNSGSENLVPVTGKNAKVRIEFLNETDIEILSENPAPLINGSVEFTFSSGANIGDVQIQAFLIVDDENPVEISSNIVVEKVVENQILLETYTTFNKNIKHEYALEETDDFNIIDNDLIIGTINMPDGEIELKDPENYLIKAFPSTITTPVTLAVVELSTNRKLMTVFYRADGAKPVIITNKNIDFTPSTLPLLEGVMINDISEDYTIKYIKPSSPRYEALSGAVDVLDVDENIIATLDKYGNLFLDEEKYQLSYKKLYQSAPPIFIVKTMNNENIFEFYISNDADNIVVSNLPLNESSPFLNIKNDDLNADSQVNLSANNNDGDNNNSDDFDNDGLSNDAESQLGLDPNSEDSDGDGINDLDEINSNQNPLKANRSLFDDISSGDTLFGILPELYALNLIKGFSEEINGEIFTNFKGELLITREQFTKIALGTSCVYCVNFDNDKKKEIFDEYLLTKFPDHNNITEDLKYCVAFAKNQGIVSGYKKQTNTGELCIDCFLPENTITRAEAIKILIETANIKQIKGNTSDKPWYYLYVVTFFYNKLFANTSQEHLHALDIQNFVKFFDLALENNTEFKTWLNSPITREDAAIFVYNIISDKTLDCRAGADGTNNSNPNDFDGDGIPNVFENQNGLNQNSADDALLDTDGDGLNNLDEFLFNKNPNQSDNDLILDTDGDGMSDFFEDKFGLDKNNPGDVDGDLDNDGMSNLDEFLFNLNPLSSDTDGGGVSDFDELFQNSNPLDANSELSQIQELEKFLESGSFINGSGIMQEEIASALYEFEETKNLQKPVYEIPADGLTEIILHAELLNKEGKIIEDDSSTIIEFAIRDASKSFALIENKQVQVTNGIAETLIKSKIKKGDFVFEARALNFPNKKHQVYVHPLVPHHIDIEVESKVIIKGGESQTPFITTVFDQYDNIVDNKSLVITLKLSGPGELIMSAPDIDKNKDGYQVATFDGTIKGNIVSKNSPGEVEIIAEVEIVNDDELFEEDGLDIGTSFTKTLMANLFSLINITNASDENTASSNESVQVVNEANIEMIAEDTSLNVGGAGTIINFFLNDEDGNLFSEANMEVNVKVLNSEMGTVSSETVRLNNGVGSVSFSTKNKAGKHIIKSSFPSYNHAELEITNLPLAAKHLKLESEELEFDNNGKDPAILILSAYDEFNNLVTNISSNTLAVKLRITKQSEMFSTFADNQSDQFIKYVYINGNNEDNSGTAEVKVYGKELSGPVNLVAKGLGNFSNISYGTINLYAKNYITHKELFPDSGEQFSANFFHGTFLGAPIGRFTEENSLGEQMLFENESRAESILTVMKDTRQFQSMVKVFAGGKIESSPTLKSNYIESSDAIILSFSKEGKEVLRTAVKTNNFSFSETNDESNEENVFTNNHILYQNIKPASDTLDQKTISFGEDDNGNLKIIRDGNIAAIVSKNGTINISDRELHIQSKLENNILTFFIKNSFNTNLISLNYFFYDPLFTTDTEIVEDLINLQNNRTYVYFKKSPQYKIEKFFTGNNHKSLEGVALYDLETPLSGAQKIGTQKTGIDKAIKDEGIGFTSDEQHILSFSAHMPIGATTLLTPSEVEILLGDPLSRLPKPIKKNDKPKFNYETDTGTLILDSLTDVQDILPIDYDQDGRKDLFAVYKSGEIYLIKNYPNYPHYINRGTILNLKNGIITAKVGDFNNDGAEDLIVSTKSACKNKDSCVYIYFNEDGVFKRQNIQITYSDRINHIEVGDLDNDNDKDIAYTDNMGNVYVTYNDFSDGNENIFREKSQLIKSAGFKIDSTQNLRSNVLVHYDGLTPPSDDDPNFSLTNINTIDGEDITEHFVKGDKSELYNLNITKIGFDLNEEMLEPSDKIQYAIYLKNTRSTDINNIKIIDYVPSSMKVMPKTFECKVVKVVSNRPILEYCNKEDNHDVINTTEVKYPFIIKNLNLPAGAERIILYEVVFESGETLPKLKVLLNKKWSDYPQDKYLDLYIKPDINPTGENHYFYSLVYNPVKKQVVYQPYVPIPPDNPPAELPKAHNLDLDNLNIDALVAEATGINNQDFNENDRPDKFELFPGLKIDIPKVCAASNISAGIGQGGGGGSGNSDGSSGDKMGEDMASSSCKGGCIPMPVNAAFLAPGTFSIMGIPGPVDIGFPVFGVGPAPWFVWPGGTAYQTTMFRLYLSPTLTLGLGLGLCLGPWLAGFCMAFKIPLPFMDGLCDSINAAVDNAMAAANNVIASTSEGSNDMAVSGSGASGSSSSGGSGGVWGASLGGEPYEANPSSKENQKSVGMDIISDWISRQVLEFGKFADIPDIIILYPELGNAFTEWNTGGQTGFDGVLTAINDFTLVNIEVEEIVFNVPWIDDAKVTAWVEDAKMWTTDFARELKRFENDVKCSGYSFLSDEEKEKMDELYPDREEICQILSVDGEALIKNINKNIQILEEYLLLPSKLVNLRNAETKYVLQILCYIEAILSFVKGLINKYKVRIRLWQRFIRNLENVWKDWKALIDLSINYMEACDKCQTERFSLLELLMKIFMMIPQIPVIEIPKLPDILIDLTSIAPVTITIPDIIIRPEPIALPKLPRITLPAIPMLSITLPNIPLLPKPPPIPELPDLPGFALPVGFPILPKPPKIPKFPVAISGAIDVAGIIIKIICLLKDSLIPVPEMTLKTQIENLTNRGLTPILPIDLSIPVPTLPAMKIEGPDFLMIKTLVNLGVLDFNLAVEIIKKASEKSNEVVSESVGGFNKFTKEMMEVLQKSVDTKAMSEKLWEELNINDQDEELSSDVSVNLKDQFKFIAENIKPQIDNYNKQIASIPKEINIKFESETILANHPILNKSIEELEYSNHEYLDSDISMLKNWGKTKQKILTSLKNNNLKTLNNKNNLETLIALNSPASIFRAEENKLPFLASKTNTVKRYKSDNNQINVPLLDGYKNKLLAYEESVDSFRQKFLISEFGEIPLVLPPENEDQSFSTMSMSDTGQDMGSEPQDKLMIGIFLFNSEGENLRIVSNIQDVDKNNLLLFEDLDNDGDKELIYTYGGKLYIKENYNDLDTCNSLSGCDLLFNDEIIEDDLADYLPQERATYNLNPASPSPGSIKMRFNNNFSYDHDFVNNKIYKSYLEFEKSKVSKLEDDVHKDQILLFKKFDNDFNSFFPAYIPNNFEGTILTRKRTILEKDSVMNIQKNILIHALQNSEIKIGDTKISLEKHQTLIPSFIESFADLLIEGGKVEIIDLNDNKEFIIENPQKDLMILFNDKILNEGDSIIRINTFSGINIITENEEVGVELGGMVEHDYEIELNSNETLIIKDVDNISEFTFSSEIENGDYFVSMENISVINSNASISNATLPALLSAQVCGDKSRPYIDIPSDYRVSVYKDLEINASKSVDLDGSIVSYGLDINPSDSVLAGESPPNITVFNDTNHTIDFDLDGVKDNDRDNPRLLFPAQTVPGDYKAILQIKDSADNESNRVIDIEVFVPKITLNSSSSISGEISGSIEGSLSEIPFSIIRKRDGVQTSYINVEANDIIGVRPDDSYLSDPFGSFSIDNLSHDNTTVIKDASSDEIASIDPESGQIIKSSAQTFIVTPSGATPPSPVLISLKNPDGTIIFSTYLIPNQDEAVHIAESSFEFTEESVKELTGVHTKQLNSTFDLDLKELTDGSNAIGIYDNDINEYLVRVESNGFVYVLNDNVILELKPFITPDEPDPNEPIIYLVKYNDIEISEIYIARNANTINVQNNNNLIGNNAGEENPLGSFDSDADGMPNDWEMKHGLNPNDPSDANGDEEVDNAGDGNGSDDGDENDNNKGDGVNNLQEFLNGSNPHVSDTDGDGIDDLEEILNNLDLTDPNDRDKIFNDLINKGILSSDFDEHSDLTRYDFTDITLKALCITPRQPMPEEKVFCDITPPEDGVDEKGKTVFEVTKEAKLLEFITGYLGVGNNIDDNSEIEQCLEGDDNNNPAFLPENPITRAEAIKIILEAMTKLKNYRDYANDSTIQNPLEFSEEFIAEAEALLKANLGEDDSIEKDDWYTPYIELSLDLLSKEEEGAIKINRNNNKEIEKLFLLTEEEAQNPNQFLKKGDFAIIIRRGLEIFNCFDKDGDGLPDDWENKFGLSDLSGDLDDSGLDDLSDPNGDPDNDGLTNLQEAGFGTDPNNPDTDNGGLKDGEEVLLNMKPLDNSDENDLTDSDGDSILDGVEKEIGTNPFLADSDGGGLNDAEELLAGSDPNSASDDASANATLPTPEEFQSIFDVPGTFVTPNNICLNIDKAGDLLENDEIIAIITNDKNGILNTEKNSSESIEVYTVSNPIKVELINE